MSTERSEVERFSGVNDSLCLPPYHLTFVLSYRQTTLILHKSLNKQRLIKEKHKQTPSPQKSANIIQKMKTLLGRMILMGRG